MQTQQKKVKWSRGETANALEERTDTGITEVSVALMENCTTDIYGNISRRPALKTIPIDYLYETNGIGGMFTAKFSPDIQGTDYLPHKFFPFYISEDDYVLLYASSGNDGGSLQVQMLRIKDGYIIASNVVNGSARSSDSVYGGKNLRIDIVQQNNYAIIATPLQVYKLQISINIRNGIDATLEHWNYEAGWYATNGTTSKKVGQEEIPGLQFNKDGLGFTGYVYTNQFGTATNYSAIDTGVPFANLSTVSQYIPAGSVVEFPNIGAYMRVEGYAATTQTGTLIFSNTIFDGVLTEGQSVPSTGTYVRAALASTTYAYYQKFVYGSLVETIGPTNDVVVRNRASSTGFSKAGVISWSEYPASSLTVMIFGPLLTPAAKSDAKDTIVTVEYGYESLTPATNMSYPLPTSVCFCEQRLWTAGWKISGVNDMQTLVIGSQIGRYTDLKNDYNLANEAITLDILTSHREEILHLIDYNGLKMFTNTSEWAYNAQTGPVKQSTNGTINSCKPIVFGSLCLYADRTGSQIRAMQYEFQNNIFDSTVINQMTPEDLVWQPIAMAQYEDKTNNTGRHLFVLNKPSTNHPDIATSNFVPGNQATIWSRWKFPKIQNQSVIYDVIDTHRYPIFLILLKGNFAGTWHIAPAVLDFNEEVDFKASARPNTHNYAINLHTNPSTGLQEYGYIPNVPVKVYNNNQYEYDTVVSATGIVQDWPWEYSNQKVTVGVPIDSTIVSHPIDVGGKTKTITKRIGKAVMSVHDTEPGAISINNKTGYMNPAKDTINFYGVTGMKHEIIYTITNNKGAKFTIESLTMNIEYGTLIS